MDFFLSHVVPVALGVLAGVVAALKFIAPRTATTVDDDWLERLEKVEDVVLSLHLDGHPASAPSAPAVK